MHSILVIPLEVIFKVTEVSSRAAAEEAEAGDASEVGSSLLRSDDDLKTIFWKGKKKGWD